MPAAIRRPRPIASESSRRFSVRPNDGRIARYPFATQPDFGVADYANNHDGMGINLHLRVRGFREPPIADIGTQFRNVRFVPKGEIAGSVGRYLPRLSDATARRC